MYGSYAVSIADTPYELESLSVGKGKTIYKVVAVNVPCPIYMDNLNTNKWLHNSNNCIIKSLVDDSIHFCSKLNIRRLIIPDYSELCNENINLSYIRDNKIDDILTDI